MKDQAMTSAAHLWVNAEVFCPCWQWWQLSISCKQMMRTTWCQQLIRKWKWKLQNHFCVLWCFISSGGVYLAVNTTWLEGLWLSPSCERPWKQDRYLVGTDRFTFQGPCLFSLLFLKGFCLCWYWYWNHCFVFVVVLFYFSQNRHSFWVILVYFAGL